MSTRGWFTLIGLSVAAAFAISGLLYGKSRSEEFGRHARTVEAIGRVRHLDRLLSEQVLAARFGLLNQYDSINATEADLASAASNLSPRIQEVMPVDAALRQALNGLQDAVRAKRAAAESFKTENSVLRNSTYYLPTAANEVGSWLADRLSTEGPLGYATSVAVQHVAQTGLAYNLIGDDSARRAHEKALADLVAAQGTIPDDLRPSFGLLVAHADVIARKVPAVDSWVAKVVDANAGDRLTVLERLYQARFDGIVAASNRYRKVLYGWSLALLVAAGVTGFQLRRLYGQLEARVALRTAELQDALGALWGEMKLARKIQEALVPTSPALSNGEIAARMRPTDEVGGDYYDVIRQPGSEWILIGDVSGHGVPAGLVMMMCHTAVRTVLDCNPDVSPDRLLAHVNRVITQNIKQLGEDKYMTISAFRRSGEGAVHFAGAHQDIQIYRAATGAVETLPSCGVWLGLKNDISDALKTQEFRLAPGDVMLLHTDGVTEARRNGSMFDVGGLRRVLHAAGKNPARDVVETIFAELSGFEVKDDATVVVVKQLPVS